MELLKKMATTDLYDLSGSLARDLLSSKTYPWEILPNIGEYILSFDPSSFQFLGKELENWEDKNVCPNHAKRNLQEHSSF